MNTPASQIHDLRNLGPKSQAVLAKAGITSIEQLQSMGAVAAYVQTKRAIGKGNLNLLWALQAALCDLPWQQVAREQRMSLLLAVEDCERGQ